MKLVFEVTLAMMFALAVTQSWAQSSDAPDPAEQMEPGEEPFQNGDRGQKGNEDSDNVSGVAMGAPRYSGTGCPQGTLSSTLSSDGKTLAIIYDQFAVRAGLNNGRRNQLHCTLRIPIQVPAGYQMEATRIDYRGFVHAPEKSRAILKAVYQILDSNGRRRQGRREKPNGRPNDKHARADREMLRKNVFKGPFSDSYLISSRLISGPQTECGEPVSLAITNVATAVSRGGGDTMITVDTIDSSSETIRYHLRWKRCQPGSPQRREKYNDNN